MFKCLTCGLESATPWCLYCNNYSYYLPENEIRIEYYYGSCKVCNGWHLLRIDPAGESQCGKG